MSVTITIGKHQLGYLLFGIIGTAMLFGLGWLAYEWLNDLWFVIQAAAAAD